MSNALQIGGYPTLRFYFNGAEQETYRGVTSCPLSPCLDKTHGFQLV